MRILVTGGAGYIGSVTVAHLLDHGHTVATIDNLSSGHRRAVDGRAVFVEGDLGDADALARLFADFRPNAVMHLAAVALVSESMKDPGKYYRENVDKGRALLDCMLAHQVTDIVFSSTAAVYGEPRRVPIQESDPLAPTNSYGETKLAFERMLHWYGVAHGVRHCSLRYFNAAGCTDRLGEQHEPETHLIPRVLGVALGQWEDVEIFGTDYETPDGSCVRDYVHILDLAEAHEKALTAVASGDSPGVVNLGNGEGYSVLEVVRTAEKVTGRPIPFRTSPRRPGDPAQLVASSERARDLLDWIPRHPDLATIVDSAWRWHHANPNGYG